MGGIAGIEALGRVLLVTGAEEFIGDRTVRAARAQVRKTDPGADEVELAGESLSPGDVAEATAPSLFSSTRFVVVKRVELAPDDAQQALVDYAGAPEPDVALVLVHSGGQKGVGLLNKLRKVSSVTEHRSEAVKAYQLPAWVATECRQHQAAIDEDAARALVEAVGPDLRGLAAAVQQLVHDFEGERLTLELVRRYYSGRAEVRGFEIADHALNGRAATALEELRWALESGATPPAITGSFASSVRGLARFKGAPRGMRDADLAKEIGVPPFKVKAVRDQARAWDEAGVASAVRAVAAADAEVKGAGSDAAYSLERMVLRICGARTGR